MYTAITFCLRIVLFAFIGVNNCLLTICSVFKVSTIKLSCIFSRTTKLLSAGAKALLFNQSSYLNLNMTLLEFSVFQLLCGMVFPLAFYVPVILTFFIFIILVVPLSSFLHWVQGFLSFCLPLSWFILAIFGSISSNTFLEKNRR